MTHAEWLADQLEGTRDWTLKLIADLNGSDWTFQPSAGMGHALWLCGHLACAQDLLVFIRCLGQPGILEPSFTDHFPIGSPVKSADEHDFPPVETVLKTMEDTHRKTCEAIRAINDSLLVEPAFAGDGKSAHPHYNDKGGAVAHLNRHEAFHAGQLATIRRLLGKPFLR